MTEHRPSDEVVREAARAARAAANEAVTPEARFFLKRHADLLERIAATRGKVADATSTTRGRLALTLPIWSQLLLSS
jgi:hypothetical protein